MWKPGKEEWNSVTASEGEERGNKEKRNPTSEEKHIGERTRKQTNKLNNKLTSRKIYKLAN